MRLITALASILIVIGALNWGLYGLFGIDLIDKFFGGKNKLVGRILYILIGLAGIYSLLYIIIV
ncbi:DUF378 domain-containing protein [Sedimentibacter sp. zth1]|uniref:DUF378 domain-containing protein n=1 Tax=Sedimentibacter sp. zth1 TaxID=2816908 RepID=UPI001A926A51|nr:DUF378 domain-containing protein [Sedimentibacter sp. zth1]QSX07046.1 DUF378 domain-containing protein [Sedimentibacter sp. zth1]